MHHSLYIHKFADKSRFLSGQGSAHSQTVACVYLCFCNWYIVVPVLYVQPCFHFSVAGATTRCTALTLAHCLPEVHICTVAGTVVLPTLLLVYCSPSRLWHSIFQQQVTLRRFAISCGDRYCSSRRNQVIFLIFLLGRTAFPEINLRE